jgi:hypothetical protein
MSEPEKQPENKCQARAEAKKRQGRRTDLENIQVKIPESEKQAKNKGQARDEAGKNVGVSGGYVGKAITLKKRRP